MWNHSSMSTHLSRSFIALLSPFFLAITSCSSNNPPATPLPYSDNSTSQGVYNDVNAYRAKLGLSPIKRHEGLDRLAKAHSEFLRQNRGKFNLSKNGNVSHIGYDGRAATARVKYDISDLHENVASGPKGTSIANLWILSPKHESTMRSNWSYTGVGVVVDSDGMIFATQLFGNTGPTEMMYRQRFGRR